MRFETIREWIYEVGYKIKGYGYRVFVTDHNGFCYLHFTDGKRVGYVQLDLGGFRIGTETAPGFTVEKDIDDVTQGMCERALHMIKPDWYNGVPRIKTFDEFEKKIFCQDYVYEL